MFRFFDVDALDRFLKWVDGHGVEMLDTPRKEAVLFNCVRDNVE